MLIWNQWGLITLLFILLLNYTKRRGHKIFCPCWHNGKRKFHKMPHTWTSGSGGWHQYSTDFTLSSTSSMGVRPHSPLPYMAPGGPSWGAGKASSHYSGNRDFLCVIRKGRILLYQDYQQYNQNLSMWIGIIVTADASHFQHSRSFLSF